LVRRSWRPLLPHGIDANDADDLLWRRALTKLGGRKQAVDDVGRAFDAVVDKGGLTVAADDEQRWRFALFQARGKLDVDLAAVVEGAPWFPGRIALNAIAK